MSIDFLPEVEAAPGWSPQASSRDDGVSLSPSNPELGTYWGDWESTTDAGMSVTQQKALSLSAFWAGITLISEAMGVMPIHVFKETKAGSWERQDQHVVEYAFNRTPNGWITPSVSKSQMQCHLFFSGNSVSVIQRNGRGQGIGYDTYLPVNTRFYLNKRNQPTYGLRDYPMADPSGLLYSTGSPAPNYLEHDYDEVLHFKAFSTNGYTGLSVLNQARNSLGLGLTVEKFGQKFFDKGRPAGFLTKEGRLSKQAKETVKEEWYNFQEGVRNAFNVGILSGGWTWQSMGYTNDDAQFLETRLFQVLEISRWLRIPPHMLGELGKATNSNIESLMLEFILYTLLPWIVKWEEEINLKMFTPKEQSMGFRAFFDVDAWLRGDSETRAKVEEMDIRNGKRTISEIRNAQHLPPYPDKLGDQPLIIASQLDTLDNVIKGTSKLHGTDKPASTTKGK